MSDEKLLIFNAHTMGSAWNGAAAFRAGQCDDQRCTLCGEEEAYDHIFTCKDLQLDRDKPDKLIATIDATQMRASIKRGVAPAMKVDPRTPFWGGGEQIACREGDLVGDAGTQKNAGLRCREAHPRDPPVNHEGHRQPLHRKRNSLEPDPWQ